MSEAKTTAQLPVIKHSDRIYLDHNATTPLAVAVRDHINAATWGNASSIHWEGREPKLLIRETRKQLAQVLDCSPLELIFTSGGSEANNMIIKGVALQAMAEQSPQKQILVSAVEHPAVIKTARSLRALGFEVEEIPVNREGEFDFDRFQSLLEKPTLLVSVMAVNNETGHIYPMKRICEMAHEKGAKVHSDMVQTLGKLPVELKSCYPVDFASFSAHKFYACKGVGLAFVRKGNSLFPLIHGGGQERHRRAGTENAVGISGLKIVSEFLKDQESHLSRITRLRDHMESQIQEKIPGVKFTKGTRVGSTSSMIIDGIDGETLLMNLDIKGVAVSTGAACSSGSPEPSPTLIAMGYSRAEAQSSMRVSLGWGTTEEEIQIFIDKLQPTIERLRTLNEASYV